MLAVRGAKPRPYRHSAQGASAWPRRREMSAEKLQWLQCGKSGAWRPPDKRRGEISNTSAGTANELKAESRDGRRGRRGRRGLVLSKDLFEQKAQEAKRNTTPERRNSWKAAGLACSAEALVLLFCLPSWQVQNKLELPGEGTGLFRAHEARGTQGRALGTSRRNCQRARRRLSALRRLPALASPRTVRKFP